MRKWVKCTVVALLVVPPVAGCAGQAPQQIPGLATGQAHTGIADSWDPCLGTCVRPPLEI